MSLKYEVIGYKTETNILSPSEVTQLVVETRKARYAVDGAGFLNSFQTYMAILEGTRAVAVLSVFFGQFLSAFKEKARNDYDFANELYFNFTNYGYNLAKVSIDFEQLKVIDTDHGNAVVGTFWRTTGNSVLIALHRDNGWEIVA